MSSYANSGQIEQLRKYTYLSASHLTNDTYNDIRVQEYIECKWIQHRARQATHEDT